MLDQLNLQNLTPEVQKAIVALKVLITVMDKQLEAGQYAAAVETCDTILDKKGSGILSFIWYNYRSRAYEKMHDYDKSFRDAKMAKSSLDNLQKKNTHSNFNELNQVLEDRVIVLRSKSKKWWQVWK